MNDDEDLYCSCCTCGDDFNHPARHQTDLDNCGECHNCFKPIHP